MQSVFSGNILDLRTFGSWNCKLENDFNELNETIETIILPCTIEVINNCFNNMLRLHTILIYREPKNLETYLTDCFQKKFSNKEHRVFDRFFSSRSQL